MQIMMLFSEGNLILLLAGQKWGRVSNFRYNCFFIWLDASLPVLDRYVDQRVDCMIDSGLLNEVRAIYYPSAVYTRGLFQAIGVREFNDFFQSYFTNKDADLHQRLTISYVLNSNDDKLKNLLNEAIGKLKANTRKLVRRQVNTFYSSNTCFSLRPVNHVLFIMTLIYTFCYV